MWRRNPDDHCDDRSSGISPPRAVNFDSKHFFNFQDVFIIPAGAAGASAELERRKFTAEEGVCIIIATLRKDDSDFCRITSLF